MNSFRNYNSRYGSFHAVSRDFFYWIQRQPYVKEESITDRLNYDLNWMNPAVVCIEFKRNEEAINGADWEWWLLFNKLDALDIHSKEFIDNTYALRFRIQAKKLSPDKQDYYYLFHYANRHGLQIDSLIQHADKDRAIPLYAIYTDVMFKEKYASLDLQRINFKLPNYCNNCKNGAFLLSATQVYNQYVKGKRTNISRDDLIKDSFPFSMLDCFISLFNRRYDDWIKYCFYRSKYCDDRSKYHKYFTNHNGYYGSDNSNQFTIESYNDIRKLIFESDYLYNHDTLPHYLKDIIRIIETRKSDEKTYEHNFENASCKKISNTIEAEHNVPDTLCGVGVIDCRDYGLLQTGFGYENTKKDRR